MRNSFSGTSADGLWANLGRHSETQEDKMQRKMGRLHATVMTMVILGLTAVGYADHHGEAQAPKVALVLVVEASDQAAYLKKGAELSSITQRLGVSMTMRTWQASVAGPATGRLVVVLEFESLSAYASGFSKVQADPGYQKVFKELQGLRKLISASLMQDVTR